MKFDIAAGDCVKDKEGRIWIWDRRHNIIGYFHGNDYDFCIANQYKEGAFDGLDMFYNDDVIYIVSQSKANILVYDISKNSFQLSEFKIKQGASLYRAIQLDVDKIIVFAHELKYSPMLFNLRKVQFEKVSLLEINPYKDRVISKIVTTESEIIIAIVGSTEILIVDKKSMRCSSKIIPYIDDIGGICADNIQDIWVVSKNGDCYVRSLAEEDICIKIGEKKEKDLFSELVKNGNYVVTIPRYASELYIYNILKKEIHTVKVPKLEEVPVSSASLFFGYFFKKNKLVLLPWQYPQILELDLDTLLVRTCMADVTGNEFWKFMLPEVLYENEEKNLPFLLEIAEKKGKKVAEEDVLGTKIWNNLNVSN